MHALTSCLQKYNCTCALNHHIHGLRIEDFCCGHYRVFLPCQKADGFLFELNQEAYFIPEGWPGMLKSASCVSEFLFCSGEGAALGVAEFSFMRQSDHIWVQKGRTFSLSRGLETHSTQRCLWTSRSHVQLPNECAPLKLGCCWGGLQRSVDLQRILVTAE